MQNKKNVPGKPRKAAGSIVLYTAASVVGLIAVTSLVNNILFFKTVVNQYAAQGYDPAEVMKQLVPSQLLPGIFEPVAIYGGIAVLLMGAGMIYQKVAKLAELPAAVEVEGDNAEDMVLEDSPVEIEDAEATGEAEVFEEDGSK